MSEQQIQKVKVKRLAHVGLWSNDVVAQARFYRQVVGLDLRSSEVHAAEQDIGVEAASAFLALGDEHHCLALFADTRGSQPNGRFPLPQSRLHHLSFEVDTDAELAALAARLNMSGVELSLEPRDGDGERGDTLWFHDPDGNRIEISVTPDESYSQYAAASGRRQARLRPLGLQHVALQTPHLETMVEFYTDALGFDISDWLLREWAWLRCNTDHHTLILLQGRPDLDHVGYRLDSGLDLLAWADYLSRHETPILWGPGRHGAGHDLFLRFADPEGCHIELSAELEQYYDQDVTTPPRLWHARPRALNLWGQLPPWVKEELPV
jgi:catechol 2,3-dioxygenase-like lactoylglutathione lyase family enzyme